MIVFRNLLAAVLCAAAFALPAAAHDYAADALSVTHPWIPAPPPGAPVAAGYLTIANDGHEADRLVAVRADFAGRTEIHEMAVNDEGVMQMRPVPDGLLIAPGDVVVLEPGGYHIMFMRPDVELVAGQRIGAVLVFERAGEVSVEFDIQEGQGMSMDHGDMDADTHDEMDMEMHDDSMDTEEGGS